MNAHPTCRKILVTGGTGFIAGYLISALRDLGHEVVALDIFPSNVAIPGVRFVRGDVRDPDAVNEAIQGCTSVFHLAAAHHDYGISRDTYFGVNETGTRVLCESMARSGATDLVFFSSVAVYGDAYPPRTEESPTKPVSNYGSSKLAGELVISEWVSGDASRAATIIRPVAVIGPGTQANMYSLMRQIHSRLYLMVGKGMNRKSVCYVQNLVDATLHVWMQRSAGKAAVYNYADKPDLSSREISIIVSRAFGRSGRLLSIPLPLADFLIGALERMLRIFVSEPTITRARLSKLFLEETVFEATAIERAGFRARTGLADALALTSRWYATEGRHMKAVHRIPPVLAANRSQVMADWM